MQIYKFYKYYYEDNADGEYDISNEDFENLIRTCCKYSAILSLNYYNFDGKKALFKKKLEKFKSLNGFPLVSFVECHNHGGTRVYYDVCPELCEILLDSANSIFDEWVSGWKMYGPDDPTFYREDGTVFMNTVTHDYEITLRPRENEDVSEIISKKGWHTHSTDKRSIKSGFCMNCVPDEKTATGIAKKIFKVTKFPYKRELKWAETTFDIKTNKWNVIFARRDFAYSICRILIDKETAFSEVFYEVI